MILKNIIIYLVSFCVALEIFLSSQIFLFLELDMKFLAKSNPCLS